MGLEDQRAGYQLLQIYNRKHQVVQCSSPLPSAAGRGGISSISCSLVIAQTVHWYFVESHRVWGCSKCWSVLDICEHSRVLHGHQDFVSFLTQDTDPGWYLKKVPFAECSRWRHCDLWAVMNSWECYINIISDMLALLSLYSNINLRSRCKTSPNVFLCFCQGGGFGWTHYRCQCDAKITWLKNALVVFCSPLLFYI